MDIERRKQAFIQLGSRLKKELELVENSSTGKISPSVLQTKMEQAGHKNPWFIPMHVKYALTAIAESLEEQKMNKWLDSYVHIKHPAAEPQTIAVIMAGNVPAVGFHDFLCVLLSGNRFLGKLSSQDEVLLPYLAELLVEIEPGFSPAISFKRGIIENFDVVIATGSDNTARYFEYYFGKYPHIIRKNRNGVAILNGKESSKQLENLGKDIFLYFGLGCRNVSKIYIPEGFAAEDLMAHFDPWKYAWEHNKYMNNYDYFKSIYLINREKFSDNGFLLMKEDHRTASPVAVLFFETYTDAGELYGRITSEAEKIQCLVADGINDENLFDIKQTNFGQAQHPELWDYADNIDTMDFLLSLRQ